MRPAAAVPVERLDDWIKKLNSEDFRVRSRATDELRMLGPAAEKALMRARENNPPLETSRRLDRLIADVYRSGEWRRLMASIKLLEEIRTPAALGLLVHLSKGDPQSRMTQEASDAFRRATSE